MSPKGTATVRAGLSGLAESSGKVSGYAPWPKGKYLLEVAEADDTKPTKAGDYMLTVKFTIVGWEDKINFDGRDPAGKTMYWRAVVQDGEHHEFQINQLKNLCNAAEVKIDPKTDTYAKGTKAFIGKQVVAAVSVGKRKDTGEDEQKWNGFFSRTDPQCPAELREEE